MTACKCPTLGKIPPVQGEDLELNHYELTIYVFENLFEAVPFCSRRFL